MPTPGSFSFLRDPEKARVVDEEVDALLLKGAIEVVDPSPGWYSQIFVVPKKDGGWRPILNLKRFNHAFLDAPVFRMYTVKDVAMLLRPGDWAASIDLKDAYFHIPVNRRHRRFLRFGWIGRLLQYLVIPFGLRVAPWLFTTVTAPLKAWLRSRGIRSIFYLDDILIVGSTKEECQANLQLALTLLQDVGFLVNHKKSHLVPSQDFIFLGLRWDTLRGSIGVDDAKRVRLATMAASMAASSAPPSCRDLQRLLGVMTSLIPAIPLILLRSRFLQRSLSTVYSTDEDADLPVTLTWEARQDLRWVAALLPRQCVAPMWPLLMEDCDVEVSTDASDVGWGIHFDGRLISGAWSARLDAPDHINAKELMTLKIFLEEVLPTSTMPRKLLWRTDSTTAMSYVRRQGGTLSLPLLRLAAEILPFALLHSIRILPVFVPSEENLLADAASRFRTLPDWHLRADVFRLLVSRWGLPAIDLFATADSALLHRFYAWGDAAGAEAYDALAQTWNFPLAYAFPPPALLPRVLRKIEVSTGVFIVVTPFWTTQKWFPLLLHARVDDVRRLPLHLDLLVDLVTGLPPSVDDRLVAWRIFGGSALPASPTPPSASSLPAGVLPHTSATTASGGPSSTFSVPEEFLSIKSI